MATQKSSAYDGWELDEQLRHIDRVLKAGKAQAGPPGDGGVFRFDPPHAGPSGNHVSTTTPARRRTAPNADRGSATGAITWLALSLGTASFVCGGILLGWSMATGRQELWTIGLPVTLVGQVGLLLGLVLQLDRLWHDNHAAAARLDNVGEQLNDLKAATTLLGASSGVQPPARSIRISPAAPARNCC